MFKNQVFLDFAKAAGKQRQRLEKCKLFSPNLERNWQVGEKIGEKRTRTARISKEQLYKLCHISKRMAKFYLDNGMIACTNTGHSTHKYIIRTSDAVAFLRDREKHPDRYRVTGVGGAGREPIVHPSINYDQAVMRAYQRLLVRKISVYPDLMTAAAISQLTGYSKKTVLTWASLGMIRWFKNAQQQYAPKELVMKHLLSREFREIRNKSDTHEEWIRELMENMNAQKNQK